MTPEGWREIAQEGVLVAHFENVLVRVIVCQFEFAEEGLSLLRSQLPKRFDSSLDCISMLFSLRRCICICSCTTRGR